MLNENPTEGNAYWKQFYILGFHLDTVWFLTHCGLMMPYGIIYQGYHWFRWWLAAYSASNHYLNEYWLSVFSNTVRKKLKWNLNKDMLISIQWNVFENVSKLILAIFFRPQCVNSLWPCDAIRWQGTESTLAQVTACCLMGIKPLPEPMLTYHQQGPVAFIGGHYHEKIWRYQSVLQDWKLHF